MKRRQKPGPKDTAFKVKLPLFCSLLLSGLVAGQPADANGGNAVFTDVKPDSEYEHALTNLVQQGIITGYPDGTYRPSAPLTRGQAAVILSRVLEVRTDKGGPPFFRDVDDDSGYYVPIRAMANAGIIQGYSDGTFKPEQHLTRAEMVKILAASFSLPKTELAVNPFTDVSSTSWYAPYLTSLINNNITAGTSLTTFSPNAPVTRGDMALFIYRCQQWAQQQQTVGVLEAEITAITSDAIWLDNESYPLTDDLKAWLTPDNLPVFQQARLKVRIVDRKIIRMESVTLRADGPLRDDKEKLPVGLAGNGAVIDTTVIVKGDNLFIKNATITGDLIIESDVRTGFNLDNVQVKGSTILSKQQGMMAAAPGYGNSGRPVLNIHDSALSSVKVALDRFTIRLSGETQVSEVDLHGNTKLEAEAGLTVPVVRIQTGALDTVLNARIDSLFVAHTDGRIHLLNNARIEDVSLGSKSDVPIIFADYERIKHQILNINGMPNLTLQPTVSGGNADYGPSVPVEAPHLTAARQAVASLFSDRTKTVLKAGVDQAAIDDAQAKVDRVADGPDKSALVADLQAAQQLLDAQLEAIANLLAATEAVNALFTDSTRTALRVGVDQAAIDGAQAKVDVVADGPDKSALVADLQAAQQLLDAQLEAIAKLLAATEAVDALFTDSTRTVLRAGVDQAAIDGAQAKVDVVADGPDKLALVADLQAAQQLLDAQLEAIAKLLAATEAVDALFIDSTRTALNAGVDQAAIDGAQAKVDRVADGPDKSALVADLQAAQQLLDAQLEASANLLAATEAVNALFTDSTRTALRAGVDQAAIDDAQAKVDVVSGGPDKAALVADLQAAQQLLDAQLEAIANLLAAAEAVNALFTDSTRTVLSAGVDQAAIDGAQVKVDVVPDGPDKAALVADLQAAQQLLDAQLEAIANLLAAAEAVNALFTDSTRTALSAGVDQAAIDDAQAKVDRVSDGTDKSALVADLQAAQQLLDAQLEAIANLLAATEAVDALFTDSTRTVLRAGVDQATIDDAQAKVDVVADGPDKSALVADLQAAQQLLDAQLEASANLLAATEAVDALFTDSTRTVLSAGVDQAAIDGAQVKVDVVPDGPDKAVLVADLQAAQQLLDAQLEAIANLLAATEAVNALFTDSTRTVLRAGVDQVAIDDAQAKVDMVADGPEKTILNDALATAHDLLNPILMAPPLTGTAPNADSIRITFTDDAAWRQHITGIYLNGETSPIHSSRINTSAAGIIDINFIHASLSPGTHLFLIKAEGYADVSVTADVPVPLTAPALDVTAPNSYTVRFTYTDDAAWRSSITGVHLNGNSSPIHSSRVNTSVPGIITVDLTGAPLSPGTHQLLIKAEGYADAVVSLEVPVPLTAPALDVTAPNSYTVRFTYTDDAAWRSNITGVHLNGNSSPIHSSRVNTSMPGVITVDVTGVSLNPGTNQFLVKAEGYADAAASLEVAVSLTAPSLLVTASDSTAVHFTFTDDAAWRDKITGIHLNRNSAPIHSSRVITTIPGLIILDLTGAPLNPGTNQFLVKAEGYTDAQALLEVHEPVNPPALTATAPNANTVRLTYTDDPVWRENIIAIHLNDYYTPIHSSLVNTSVPGVIEINITGAYIIPGMQYFTVKARGYAEAGAEVMIVP